MMPDQIPPELSSKYLHPVIVIGNSSTNSLGVIRAFGRRGIPVFTISTDSARSAMNRSRYVKKQITINSWQANDLKEALLSIEARQIAEQYVVFPTTDAALLEYSLVRGGLGGSFVDMVPQRRMVEFCINKNQFYDFCERSNIAHPTSFFLNGSLPAEVEIRKTKTFPLAVKPVQSHDFSIRFQRKLFVADSYRELQQLYRLINSGDPPMLLQELITGDNFYMVSFFRANAGKQWAAAGLKKVRQSPTDHGTGSIVEIYNDEKLIERSAEILEKIGYEGIGEIEFKIDPVSGEAKVLEINARSVTFNRLIALSGLDLEYLYYLASLKLLPESFVLSAPEKILRWVDFFKDFGSALSSWRDNSLTLSEWFREYRRSDMEGYFAKDDLRPFIVEGRNFLSSGLRHVFRR
ncbi:MAG: hypothetical protein ACRBF0_03920 [Calditrichia bacterium]